MLQPSTLWIMIVRVVHVCSDISVVFFLDVSVSVPAMVSVGEGDGMVQVCATLSAVEDTERNLTITVSTSDGTGENEITQKDLMNTDFFKIALDGSDYNSVSSTEIFTSGSTDGATRCVNITIIDDGALEGNQTFTVVETTRDVDVVIGTNITTIKIVDNDSEK